MKKLTITLSEQKALNECEAILKKSGSSFRYAVKLVKTPERYALAALYAFCRLVDDAVDKADSDTVAFRELNDWRRELLQIEAGTPAHPVSIALRWALSTFQVRSTYLRLILEGVSWDISKKSYRDFNDLYAYCYRVASAVGLFIIEIFGPASPRLKCYAELTGIALQLTNILRDVQEDALKNRVYLPENELAWFNLKREDILKQRSSEVLNRFILFQTKRTQAIYDLAAALLSAQDKKKLYFAETARLTYQAILNQIHQNNGDVYSQPIHLPYYQKLWLLSRTFKNRVLP